MANAAMAAVAKKYKGIYVKANLWYKGMYKELMYKGIYVQGKLCIREWNLCISI